MKKAVLVETYRAGIAHAVRKAREAAQLSQRDLAKASGLSLDAVSRLEREAPGSAPNVATLIQVSAVLGVAVQALLPPTAPSPPQTYTERLGAEIARRRFAHGLTQTQLAARAGLSLDGVLRIEKGRSACRITSLVDVAAALETTPSSLLAAAEQAEG